MSPEIITVLIILGITVILFITEWIRPDVTALLVLATLSLTGLVSPEEALSGFSNPAVVTVWAILILSAAISRTGIASLIGRQIQRWGGSGESKLLSIIMLSAGILSGFMNSIGVASLFLPVVTDIAKNTKRPPSKLLMPLAYAALLGGLVTLIGTPANILISEALSKAGLEPFSMFDFTPIGSIAMFVGIIYMVFIGKKLLPTRDITQDLSSQEQNTKDIFELRERMGIIKIPVKSTFIGKSIINSRLGVAFGLNVIAILRDDHTLLAPSPQDIIRPGDRLLVEGRLERIKEYYGQLQLSLEDENFSIERLTSKDIKLAECQIIADSPLAGKTLGQLNFRRRFGPVVLAIRRGPDTWRTNLERIYLQKGDILLIHGTQEQFKVLDSSSLSLSVNPINTEIYNLQERLMLLRVQSTSALVGKTLTESRLGEAFGLGVMGIIREGKLVLIPDPDSPLEIEDLLLVKGKPSDLFTVQGLQDLQIGTENLPRLEDLESSQIGLHQVVLSPYTTLVGRTLEELHFREKYSLNVLAIWRAGRSFRSNLRDMTLRFGDALLVYGPHKKFSVLGSDPDFLVLTEASQEKPRRSKAPLAVLIMAIVLLPVILGWVNIAIATIAGVVLMVITGCINIDEAYRSIQLNAIFLIAGMLPLGIALQNTGAANMLADSIVFLVRPFGSTAVMAGLFILAALGSQVMPNPAVAVLLAPIALNTAANLGISPYPLMMTIAISASAAFLSPVGHSANVLVMGPGGYKFSDYTRVGLPLTLILMLVVLLVLPIFWPL